MSMLGPMSIVRLMLMYIHAEADFDVYAETDIDTNADVDIQAEGSTDACTSRRLYRWLYDCTLHAGFSEYSSYFLCTFVKTFSSIHFGT